MCYVKICIALILTMANVRAILLFVLFTYLKAQDISEIPVDVRACIHGCTYSRFPKNQQLCRQCSVDPILNNNMCKYACGTEIIHQTNIPYLVQICEACFTDATIMQDVCSHCVWRKYSQRNSRLCGECYIKGYIK